MEIKRLLPLLFVALIVATPVVHASILDDFLKGITAPVTRTFDTVHKFLLKLEVVGLHVVEVLLFIVFIALLVFIFVAPAWIYRKVREATSPARAFFDWVRR